jgi:hypothetical protein
MSNTNTDFSKIQGTLVYVQINEPVKAYVKPGTPPKPDEWKAGVVLTDEDYVDDLEAYAKSLDTLLGLKKVKSADFEAAYKVPAPEGAGKNVWVLTLRKSVELGKTGKPVPDLYKPKVFEKIKNTLVDITNSKLVGNGSIGTISVDRFDRTSGGSSLYLKNVLVTDLIEYVKADSDYESGSEFDDEAPAPKPAVKTVAKPAPKPTSKAKAIQAAEEEDDLPF